MLRKLSVQNYVLIEQLAVEFHQGLNIITGETGAGKSILLGALSLILGERADKAALLDASKKCIVEAEFVVERKSIADFFRAHELDIEPTIIIRREITAEGKSRSFINDTPVTLSQLKELSELLVDVHSQHETLFLRQSKFQLSVLDAFAKTEDDLIRYKTAFYDYQKNKKRLTELEEEEKKSKADSDYYLFLFNELDKAGLKEGEQELLEDELNTMTHSEEIKGNLNLITTELNGSEDNFLNRIARIQLLLQQSAKHHSQLNDLSERLKSVSIEMKDIAAEVEVVSDEITFDPARIEEINSRLNDIYRLQQKHRAKTVAELINLKSDFESKLKNIESLDEQLATLRLQVDELKKSLITSAKKLSAKRNKAIPEAEKEIIALLSSVNMPNAVFKIADEVSTEDNFNADGIDEVRFLFSANKGVSLREISKAASGGELSRLMLCIKAAVAKLMSLPTIIFDEIDTGISGETAMNVGKVLKQLSLRHQLIAITHLPQIAGRGEAHYYIYKEAGPQKTSAKIKLLNKDERIVEIAKMLSGEKPTAVAMENAKELLKG